MTNKQFNKNISIAASLMALAIIMGAFGAHAFKDIFSDYQMSVYEKANFYHFITAIGLFLMALTKFPFVKKAFLFNLIGGSIFSISLYALAITNIRILGAITPIGGTLMIFSWIYFSYKLYRLK